MHTSVKKLISLITLIFLVSLITIFIEKYFFNRFIAQGSNKPSYSACAIDKKFNSSEKNRIELMPKASKKAVPAVVHISNPNFNPGAINYRNFPFNNNRLGKRKNQSLGSGIIITSNGYILTNNHVIKNLGDNIQVETINGDSFKAKIVGTDPKTDLAIIKIDTDNLPHICFGDSDLVEIGDIVLAIGNPFGIGETVTMGIISATGRSNIGIVDYENFIQTDAAINPGNSGGALVNLQGELIGINTAILTKSGGYEGISFAIPSNTAKKVLRDLMMKGKVERGWLGVAIQDINPETAKIIKFGGDKGVIVIDSVKGSPANNAGIKKGDVIISVNGKEILDKKQLKNIIVDSPIGSRLEVNIIRQGLKKDVNVEISKMPENIEFFDVKNFMYPPG